MFPHEKIASDLHKTNQHIDELNKRIQQLETENKRLYTLFNEAEELTLTNVQSLFKAELDALASAERIAFVDAIIQPLFQTRWSGDLANAPVKKMREQLMKTLLDQTAGYWSGHTAYHIAIDGGFLINAKRGTNKQLTTLGNLFMSQQDHQQTNNTSDNTDTI